MSKNFNNNSIVDSTLNLTVQNLTNTVSLLPTQSNVNTTVTNAIVLTFDCVGNKDTVLVRF